jgi:serine/threonine protein kinase
VNHPNLVQFLGICDDNSGIYLITEYVEHGKIFLNLRIFCNLFLGDLFDLLIFGERELDWKNKVKIALQIAQACFYLHSKGNIQLEKKMRN